MLPKGLETIKVKTKELTSGWVDVFVSFFRKKGIVSGMFFLLFYRFAESQLVKIASPFLLDSQEAGGLALTTAQVGFVYGTIGIICLTVGGILGGLIASRDGLKKWVVWMALSINIPDLVYVYLSQVQPDNFLIITICVAIEQFGYGFGFTGYMLFMLYLAEGEFKTSHYAIATAFMALGMMIPGMISGKLQDLMGYKLFFIYIMICTIPSFLVAGLAKIDPGFGKKKE
jgi:PAT family beta-lactamase induction signal transducer AmpG